MATNSTNQKMMRSLLMTTQIVDQDDPILGFTHDWIATLAQQVTELHIVTPRKGRTSLPQNVTIHHLTNRTEPISTVANHAFHHRMFRQLILRNRVHALLVHMIPKWVIAAYPYTKLRKIPLALWYTHASVDRRLKMAHQLATHIFTASEESYRLEGAHVHVVGHGIDTERFKPMKGVRKNGRFHIIMPGRIAPTKQPHLLIEAIASLPNTAKEAIQCQIIGKPGTSEDIQYEAKLKALIASHQLTESVQLTGAIPYPEMRQHYQSTDLVINLSQTNSLDKTVLEAMACGALVISSNPACRTILEPIDLHLGFAHGDQHALTQRIHYWQHRDSDVRLLLGQQLREVVIQRHNLDRLMEKITGELKHL